MRRSLSGANVGRSTTGNRRVSGSPTPVKQAWCGEVRHRPALLTVTLRRSLCCSSRRRFDSSSQSILWASHVLTPAARNRIISPFCRCTMRRASATCSSTRRRSSSKLIVTRAITWVLAALLARLTPNRGRNGVPLLGHEQSNERRVCLHRAAIQGR
jgi:hypothetical protein